MIPPDRLFGVLTPFQRIVDVPVTLNFRLFFFDSSSPQQRERMDYDYKSRQAENKSPDHPLKPAYTESMSEFVQIINYVFHALTSVQEYSHRPLAAMSRWFVLRLHNIVPSDALARQLVTIAAGWPLDGAGTEFLQEPYHPFPVVTGQCSLIGKYISGD